MDKWASLVALACSEQSLGFSQLPGTPYALPELLGMLLNLATLCLFMKAIHYYKG